MTPAAILSAMLAIASPGVQPLSRVMLDDLLPTIGGCDEECQDLGIALYGDPPRLDFVGLGGRVRWPGWSQQETREEALSRWATIADAIDLARREEPRWPGRRRDLAVLLVVVARAESAYWRPVHEGRLRGRAGEWGLWQCHPTLPGCDASLVGIDPAPTLRAAKFAAAQLTSARLVQLRDCPGAEWVGPTLRAYASGAGCTGELPGLDARLAWWRAASTARLLSPEALGGQRAELERRSRSPVPGYDRATFGECPSAVRALAKDVATSLGRHAASRVGELIGTDSAPAYRVLVERHAGGRIGASVLVRSGAEAAP